jgi:hypothetical protein
VRVRGECSALEERPCVWQPSSRPHFGSVGTYNSSHSRALEFSPIHAPLWRRALSPTPSKHLAPVHGPLLHPESIRSSVLIRNSVVGGARPSGCCSMSAGPTRAFTPSPAGATNARDRRTKGGPNERTQRQAARVMQRRGPHAHRQPPGAREGTGHARGARPVAFRAATKTASAEPWTVTTSSSCERSRRMTWN